MTQRERYLASILLVVVVVLGGGVLFHLFVYEPISTVREELRIAQEQRDRKKNELQQSKEQIDRILGMNPRLSQWQKISLPPRNPLAAKLGVSLEEQKRKHQAQMQVEYEKYLSELMRASGFRGDSIVITPRQPDRRSAAPAVKGKEPAYERLAFSATGKGTVSNLVRLMRDFYRTELLHQIRNLTVQLAQERSSTSSRRDTTDGGLLDVNLTVEALLVQGAEERTTLMPAKLGYPPRVLADPSRDYEKMSKRNMFTGISPPPPPPPEPSTEPPPVTEDRAEVLRFVKLTTLWYDSERRRWEATLYDQAKGGLEKKINARTRDNFIITDKDENEILKGIVVYVDEKQVIFKVESEGKFYRMYCGDFMYPAMEKAIPTKEVEALGISVKAK